MAALVTARPNGLYGDNT